MVRRTTKAILGKVGQNNELALAEFSRVYISHFIVTCRRLQKEILFSFSYIFLSFPKVISLSLSLKDYTVYAPHDLDSVMLRTITGNIHRVCVYALISLRFAAAKS